MRSAPGMCPAGPGEASGERDERGLDVFTVGDCGILQQIVLSGADASIPPVAMSAAAPEGMPRRRISERILTLPCPARGPDAGKTRSFCSISKTNSSTRALS
jgi:hypothetical protein